MSTLVVVDTSVFVSARLGPRGASRHVIRGCLLGRLQPVVGTALFLEYEDVLGRDDLFASCLLSRQEREELLDAFLSVCTWQQIYYAWRPNLPDEADNHLIELAIAADANAIVTRNVKDLRRGELTFPGLRVLTPEEFVKEESWE